MPIRVVFVLINVAWAAVVSAVYPFFGVLVLLFLNFGRPQDDRPNLVPYHIPMVMVIAVVLGTAFRLRAVGTPMIAGIKRLWIILILYMLYWLSALNDWTDASSNRLYEITLLILLCVLTLAFVGKEKRLQAYVLTMIASGTFVVLTVLRNPSHITEHIGGEKYDRMAIAKGGTVFGNSNYLALFMVITIFLSVALMGFHRAIWRRAVLLAVAGSAGYVFFRANSRGASIALAVGTFLWWLMNKRRLKNAIIGIVLLAAGASLAPQSYWDRLSTVATYKEDASATDRLELWNIAFNLIGEHPLLGVGPDNFTKYAFNTPHNAYLQIGSEVGIPALLVYVTMLFGGLRSAWRARINCIQQGRTGSFTFAASQGIFCCITAVFIQGFTTGLAHREVVYVLVTSGYCVDEVAKKFCPTEANDGSSTLEADELSGCKIPIPAVGDVNIE